MNHPTPDELVKFLDEELPAERQAEVSEHVLACDRMPPASGFVAGRPRGAAPGGCPRRRRPSCFRNFAPSRVVHGAVPWPRPSCSPPDLDWRGCRASAPTWRASALDWRARFAVTCKMSSGLIGKICVEPRVRQEAFLSAVTERLDELELQWLADYVNLRRDVETVAIRTQEGLERLAGDEPLQQGVP